VGLATSFLSFVEGSVFLRALVSAIAVFIVASLGSLIEIYIERKLWARIMSRYGPTEVGRYGSLQLFADAIKLVVKEDFTPLGADKPLYNAVPVIGVATTFVALMVIPFDYTLSLLFPKSLNPQLFVFSNFEPSLLVAFAFFALEPILVLLGGWAGGSKYTLVGGFRSAAQLISYEIPIILTFLSVVALTKSMNIFTIVLDQAHSFPFALLEFPAFILFLVSLLAELERTPFDLTEADSELVAGWNTEYGGAKFLLVYLNEYLRAFTGSAILVCLFLGGWLGPAPIPAIVWLFLKTILVFTLLVWIRAAYPRVRIDQMLNLGWKYLVPLSVVWLLVTPFIAMAALSHGLLILR
jgi:NADH-quinone oxidoreductase subunit H